jgi:hypothetical protein
MPSADMPAKGRIMEKLRKINGRETEADDQKFSEIEGSSTTVP